MRIVIDLQGAQGASRFRGIGRYSLSIAQAIVRNRGDHEVMIALNGLFPDTIEPIRAAFEGLLPQGNIRVWCARGPIHALETSNTWRRKTAELVREAFLAALQPDVLLITSLFEGFEDDAVHSIGLFSSSIPTAVIMHDLIPLIHSDVYLTPNPAYERFYMAQLSHLLRADLYLANSESSRQEAISHLGRRPEGVVTISSAVDGYFKPMKSTRADKTSFLKRFGLTRPFLMYSGATDERKNHLRLIKAFSLLPAELRDSHQLAIIGGMPVDHRKRFEEYIKRCGLDFDDVVITGRVADGEMVKFYNFCRLFVFASWHEGFGLPALEAMSCGAPVIGANTTSLPEVIGREDALFDPFDEIAISSKIRQVLENEVFSLALSQHGLQQCKKFSWDASAKRAVEVFEEFLSKRARETRAHHPVSRKFLVSSLIDAVVALEGQPIDEQDWLSTARSIARNHPASSERKLLVDISELVHRDAKTGIQRVVRSVLTMLLANPPEGFSVAPVYATIDQPGYRFARKFTRQFFHAFEPEMEDEPVEVFNGDIFLGLDLQPDVVPVQSAFYRHLREIGGQVYFVVYDLLPVLLPKAFPDGACHNHTRWLETLAQNDGVICISQAVAGEMSDWMSVFGPKRLRPFHIGWFHLGADVESSVPTKGLPSDSEFAISKLASRPTFLSVGTIEPRKGIMQSIMAFEYLWKNGVDVNLVIVGRQVDSLIEKLRRHSELDRRLFWLNNISDEYLEKIYAVSSCLIAASEGEGFGLPLIEAALHKLPIIGRDIPVFREVASEHAYYFADDNDPFALAHAIIEWLALYRKNGHPKSDNMPWLTWQRSTQNLLDVIIGGNWYKRWISDDTHRYWGGDRRFGTQVGERAGRNMVSTAQAGYLIYGPYLALDSGEYSVVIHGTLGADGASGAWADVAIDKGDCILAEGELTTPEMGDSLAVMQITLENPCRDLEIRIKVGAKDKIEISMVIVKPALQNGLDTLLTNDFIETPDGSKAISDDGHRDSANMSIMVKPGYKIRMNRKRLVSKPVNSIFRRIISLKCML